MKPIIPEHAAGALMLPPISVPIANGTHLAETSAASPPELPAHVLVISYGFKAQPNILFTECPA